MLPIILSISDDNDRAFVEELYIRYEKKLYTISMKYLNHHHDAQDCVHETIGVVSEKVEKFKLAQETGYIDRLIGTVCRNCALNMLRVRNRRNEYESSLLRYNYEEDVYEEIDIPDYSECVDRAYLSEEACDNLHNLINKLDDKYRDVILLKSLGLDNKAIAETMNISEELVRQRYLRAKKQLLKMGGKDLYAE